MGLLFVAVDPFSTTFMASRHSLGSGFRRGRSFLLHFQCQLQYKQYFTVNVIIIVLESEPLTYSTYSNLS